MTIDEAIEHAKYTANANYEMASAYHNDFGVYNREETRCRNCAEEHEQLADWLEELKAYKESLALKKEFYEGVKQGRTDALEEIEKAMHEAYKGTSHQWECMIFDLKMRELKEQKNDS